MQEGVLLKKREMWLLPGYRDFAGWWIFPPNTDSALNKK
jgi:hypothetical protein